MVAGGRGAWSANFVCPGSVTTPLLAVRHGLLGKAGTVWMMETGNSSKTNIRVHNLPSR